MTQNQKFSNTIIAVRIIIVIVVIIAVASSFFRLVPSIRSSAYTYHEEHLASIITLHEESCDATFCIDQMLIEEALTKSPSADGEIELAEVQLPNGEAIVLYCTPDALKAKLEDLQNGDYVCCSFQQTIALQDSIAPEFVGVDIFVVSRQTLEYYLRRMVEEEQDYCYIPSVEPGLGIKLSLEEILVYYCFLEEFDVPIATIIPDIGSLPQSL